MTPDSDSFNLNTLGPACYEFSYNEHPATTSILSSQKGTLLIDINLQEVPLPLTKSQFLRIKLLVTNGTQCVMLYLHVPINQHGEKPEPGMTVHHDRVRTDTTGVRTCTKVRDQTHCYLHTHLKQPKLVLSYRPSSSCMVTVVLKHIAGYRLGFQKPDGYILLCRTCSHCGD